MAVDRTFLACSSETMFLLVSPSPGPRPPAPCALPSNEQLSRRDDGEGPRTPGAAFDVRACVCVHEPRHWCIINQFHSNAAAL